MYQKPNKHGVYEDAEYVIKIPVGKKASVTIELALIDESLWGWAVNVKTEKSESCSPIMAKDARKDWKECVIAAIDCAAVPHSLIADFNFATSTFINSLPVLRIEDFKITQEAKKPMAKKKPESVTEPAATTANEPPATVPATPPEPDKIYLHMWTPGGYSTPMAVMQPITEVGKRTISDSIDDGNRAEIITKEAFEQLRAGSGDLPRPTDEKHAEVCKLADYEPMVKKTIACSEYFDHQFSSDEIKQMAAEFSQSTGRKSDLEEELKSHAQYLKSQITEVTATINRISQELGRGKRSENVKCHWIFNEPSRGQKSLYRLDTEPKELVRIAVMTASDKQMTLDDIAIAKQKTERTLEEKPITAITNQPYEGEMMTDAEVKEEIGVVAPESVAPETDAGDQGGESEETESEADGSDDCPI